VGQMRHYKKDFHPDIDFLTGTPDQIAAVTKAYRVYFNKVSGSVVSISHWHAYICYLIQANENADDENDYLVDHSIVLYLVSPNGEFLDFFTQKMQVNDIIDRVEKHAKNYK
jgi:protein SCO1